MKFLYITCILWRSFRSNSFGFKYEGFYACGSNGAKDI